MAVQLFLGMFLFFSVFQRPGDHQQEYLTRHYTIEDGLPVNSVNGMVQDDAGYLYISTYDGLVRYDGYEFKVYNSGNTKGLKTNRIAGILKARDNTIWLFNEDGSVTSKSGNHFRTYTSPDIPGQAHRLIKGNNGRLWVAGSEGIAFFDKKESTFKKLDDPVFASGSEVMGAGTHGELYAINDLGLVAWNKGTASVLLGIDDLPMAASDIREIKQFKDNVLWFVGVSGIFRFNTVTKKVDLVKIPGEKDFTFWNITPKGKGKYILTGNLGFYLLNSKNLALQKLPIPIHSGIARTKLIFSGKKNEEIYIGDNEVLINGITALQAPSIKYGFMDKEGSLWIGSEKEGLYQIRKSSFTNLTAPQIPGLTNIYSIIQDRTGSIWTCSLNSGITRISGSGTENWNHFNSSLPVDACKFLYEDSDGTIYAGLNNNSFRKFNHGDWIKPQNFNNILSDKLDNPEAMFRDGGRLFIGNDHSLVVYKNDSSRFFDASKPRQLASIQVFRENSKGVIFAGTSGNGLNRIESDDFINYSAKEGILNSNIIRDIFLQSDDTLWIATENLGLNRVILDDNGEVLSSASVTAKDGLTDNSLHRIIEDPHGNLWISSNGGIMRIPQKSLNEYADGTISTLPVLGFNEKDGMVNREANGGVQSAGILTSDNKLWFPNQQGVTIIDPADFYGHQNLDTPRPLFESIELEKGVLFIGNLPRVTIPYHERDLRINFTAPNFAYPDRVHFSYKLDGVNHTWQSADQSRQAVFTGIPPGAHTFTIRAEFIGGQPVETSTVIIIPRYFYETGWFAAFLVLGGIGMIAGVYKIRVRSLKEREKKLQQRVDEQTEALKKADEQKSRFFTGITHELKTPLSLIVGPLNDIAEQSKEILPPLIQTRLSMMQRNSHQLKNLVDQILDVSKLNAGAVNLMLQPVELEKITRQIAGQFQSRLEQEEVSLEISAPPLDEPIYIDRDAWERILINLLTNAIKFSPRGGTIYVELRNEESGVVFSIKDEGKGIAKEDQDKVFEYLYQVEGKHASEGTGIGLFLVKGLVEHMGGSTTLISEEGKGAEFIIRLQKGYQHVDPIHTLSHEPLVEGATVYPELESISPVITHPKKTDNEFEKQVMIVEDNYDFRSYLQSILSFRYRVLLAANGEEAFDILQHERPDIIISDILMPEMNGLEFVNSLRKKDPFKYLPVIFLSAKNRDADVEKGLSTGADIYLTKPIRSNLLLTQIAAVLRRENILSNESITENEQQEPEFKQKVRQVVYRQMGNSSLTVNMLADALYISRAKLYMEWEKVSDISPNNFIKKIRLEEAHVLLKERGFNVQEAARAVGYSNPNYFSTSFKEEYGVSPSQLY